MPATGTTNTEMITTATALITFVEISSAVSSSCTRIRSERADWSVVPSTRDPNGWRRPPIRRLALIPDTLVRLVNAVARNPVNLPSYPGATSHTDPEPG